MAEQEEIRGNAMVSQCANPECGRKLRYLRDGKIYSFALSVMAGGKRQQFFWLCGQCSSNMILTCVNGSTVKIRARSVPLPTLERTDART